MSASFLHPSERMKDPRGACHVSVTINSAPLAAGSSSEEAVISDRKNRLERIMLDCSYFYFLCAISETPRIFVCFSVCRNRWAYRVCRACRNQTFCPFNLLTFLSLLTLALRKLPVLLRGETRCTCHSSQSLVRQDSRHERSRQ